MDLTRLGSMAGQVALELALSFSVLWAAWAVNFWTIKAPVSGLGLICGVTKPRWIWVVLFPALQTRNRGQAKKHTMVLGQRNCVVCHTHTFN